MAGDFLIFQLLYEMAQSIAAGVQVGIVDLLGVAGQNDFRVLANARDERLYHVGGKILSFVANDELPGNAPAADIG